MNLSQILTASAGERGPSVVLKLDDREVSYAELEALSARLAGVLAERGVRPGDRVALQVPNVPEFAIAYYAILRAGAIAVPLGTLLSTREVAFHLEDSGARLVLDEGSVAGLLADAPVQAGVCPRAGSDTAVILYTSGTTGTPKGAELTHGSLRRNAEEVRKLRDLTARDVTLGALPLFHSFGQTCALNATVLAGATVTLLARFDAGRALAVMERDGVTVFQGVPTMYAALLDHPQRERYDLSSLRRCVSGGAPMPRELMREFEAVFGCPVLEGYGLSETSPVAASNRVDGNRKPGSIGTPLDGVEMRVVGEDGRVLAPGEVGELAIRGHNVMKGYWNRPQETAEVLSPDGWLLTGDLGYVDADGDFFIAGRRKDVIIRGGYNVYPAEVESVLLEHPAVREAAVVGLEHPLLGEEVGAAVVRHPGTDCAEAELREFARERVAAYKYPRAIWFLDELPKGSTGKVLKRAIERPAIAPVAG